MLALGVCLIATFVAAELFVIKEFPRFGRWIRSNTKKSLLFSISLSLVFVKMFPAHGMLVMMAGLASTVVVQPVYRALDFRDRNLPIWKYRYAVLKHKVAMIVWRINVWRHRWYIVRHPITALKLRFRR